MKFPIPTSGEASFGLKGRFGGARRYGRRRFTPRRNTFWFAKDATTLSSAGTVYTMGSNANNATLMWEWTPGKDTNEVYSEKLKLLKMQGRIPVWASYFTEDQTSFFNAGGGISEPKGPVRLWYWWSRQAIPNNQAEVANAATGQDPSNMSGDGGDLEYILRRNDVLRWGYIDVPVHRPRFAWGIDLQGNAASGGSTPFYGPSNYLPDYPAHPFAYVPLPRLSRGMNLERGQMLCLYGRSLQYNYNNLSWDNISPIVQVVYQRDMRLLLSR